MTTIDPDKRIQQIPGSQAVKSRSKPQKNDFNAIFQQAIDTKAIEPTNIESTALASDVRPARFSPEAQPATHMVVDRVERLIDTMANYQNKLIENGVTLKDMQSLVEQMTSQGESLAAISQAGDESENLKSIVNQSLMLSSMEIAKYNGGYYNDR